MPTSPRITLTLAVGLVVLLASCGAPDGSHADDPVKSVPDSSGAVAVVPPDAELDVPAAAAESSGPIDEPAARLIGIADFVWTDLTGVRGEFEAGGQVLRVDDSGVCIIEPETMTRCRPEHRLSPSVTATMTEPSEGKSVRRLTVWADLAYERVRLVAPSGDVVCEEMLAAVPGIDSVGFAACQPGENPVVDLSSYEKIFIDRDGVEWQMRTDG